MPDLQRDGGSINYQVSGSNGPWIIFISGLGGHGAFWDAQVEAFSDKYRVLTHDHRGIGNSTGGGPDSGIEQAALDVFALMDHLDIESATIAGHSMGGMIAQQLTVDHPDRVDRLVISGSGPCVDDYGRLVLEFRCRVIEELGPEGFCRLQTILTAGDLAKSLDIEDILALETSSLNGLPDPVLVKARLESIMRFDRVAELALIAVPTLILSAKDDKQARPIGGETLNAMINASSFELLSGGGHFFPKTQPQVYTDLLLRFFAEHEVKTATGPDPDSLASTA